MDKLNVCLINDSFPPLIDGVANAVFNYASIINRDYGNVMVATPEFQGVEDNYDFPVLRYPSIDTTKFVGYPTGIPFSINYLSQFNETNIDIIHSHCPITSTMLARIIRDKVHKPIILTYHTKFDIDIRKAIDKKLLQEVAINALVSNIKAVDEVWAVSKGAGENLKSLGYKGDYIVMPNGVDFTKGKASEKEIEEIKTKYHIPNNKPVYLFVGRLMWYKGIKIIIDALREVKNHGQDFYMVFVGDGMDGQEIRDYVKEKELENDCIFTGSISDRETLKAIFSSCDLFLFPSTFDTNGIVVREAASAALGSVLIKGSCAAEDTIDKQNCFWIDENSESLAKLLLDYGNNVDFYHQVGLNAQNELYLSWDDSVKMAVERYKVVLEKYQYSEPKNPLNPVENVFGLFSDMSDALYKVRTTSKDISTVYNLSTENFLNHFVTHRELKEKQQLETREMIKRHTEEERALRDKNLLELKLLKQEHHRQLKEENEDLKQKIDGILDRYL